MRIIKKHGGYDIDTLEFIGKGTQGSVYRINDEKCIKIFKKRKSCKKEVKTLKMAQGDIFFPKLYDCGEKYIIRECINGLELDKYLKLYPLTPEISTKVLEVYDAIKRVGYTRLDAMLFHIFVTCHGNFKVIDTARVMKEKTTCPRRLLEGLEELGWKETFLNHVKALRPELYEQWLEKCKN